jgi:hypothetical protein
MGSTRSQRIGSGLEDDGREAMARTVVAGNSTPDQSPDAPGSDAHRTWDRAFAAVVIAALPILMWFGREQWFFLDEWVFLSERSMAPADLLADHNGHWVTTPLMVYRGLYALVGLHSYVPYQLLVVLTHLALAVVLRQLMLHLRVAHGVATALAVVFIFFGAGNQNIFFAFQISLNGALLGGLVQFLLADHPGVDRRRDLLAVGAGVVGITASAVAVPVIVGVGVAVALRRGLRAAAVQTLPPALIFGTWYLTFNERSSEPFAGVGPTVEFGGRTAGATFWALGQHLVPALVIASVACVAILAGVRAAVLRRDAAAFAGVAGLAWTLLVGSIALSRAALLDDWPQLPESSRYLHHSLALALPIIGAGATVMYRAFRPLILIPLLAIGVGLPGSLDALMNPSPFTFGSKERVLAVANSRFIEDVPPSQSTGIRFGLAEGGEGDMITAGWLANARRDGKVPGAGDIPLASRLTADASLALTKHSPLSEHSCSAPQAADRWRLEAGDVVVHQHDSIAISAVAGEVTGEPVNFADRSVKVLAGPLEVEITDVNGAPAEICLERQEAALP